MPTRDQVLAVLREHGGDYEAASLELGLWPGLAYLIATGMPADGSDGYSGEELRRPGVLPGTSQHLVSRHGTPLDPTTDPGVRRWVHGRVEADPAMRAADRRAKEDAS